MWAGLRVEISCFSTTSTDALNMVGTAVQPVINHPTSQRYWQTLIKLAHCVQPTSSCSTSLSPLPLSAHGPSASQPQKLGIPFRSKLGIHLLKLRLRNYWKPITLPTTDRPSAPPGDPRASDSILLINVDIVHVKHYMRMYVCMYVI